MTRQEVRSSCLEKKPAPAVNNRLLDSHLGKGDKMARKLQKNVSFRRLLSAARLRSDQKAVNDKLSRLHSPFTVQHRGCRNHWDRRCIPGYRFCTSQTATRAGGLARRECTLSNPRRPRAKDVIIRLLAVEWACRGIVPLTCQCEMNSHRT